MSLCKYLTLIFLSYLMIFMSTTLFAATDKQKKMLEQLNQLDQLDQLDHLDFSELNDRAIDCIITRDFPCAEKNIVLATKYAGSSQDKYSLLETQKNLLTEKQRVEEERIKQEEEDRLLAEKEERLQQEQENAEEEARREAKRQAEEEEENSGPSTVEKIALFGTLMAQNYANIQAERRANSEEVDRITNKRNADFKAYNDRQQQRFAEQRAELSSGRKQLQSNRNEQVKLAKEQRLALVAERAKQRENKEPSILSPTVSSHRVATASTNNNLEQSQNSNSRTFVKRNHGVPCGPDKRCILGMSGMRDCEPGIPSPTAAHCEEGCEIRGWGALYHDITLPKDRVYLGSGKLCAVGCTIPNFCED